MSDDFTVRLDDAVDPIVLALDVGSTASRGGLYDGSGRPIKGHKHKVEHSFSTGADGSSTIDADQVVAELSEIITRLTDGAHAKRIAGVALDTFASSLVGVGRGGGAVTPCYTYADARCGSEVEALRAELDEPAVQQQTGTRLHSSYLPARLRWLERTEPGLVARTPRWMSLGEYVHHKLLGVTAAATSTAAWSGLLDRMTGDWHGELLETSGVRRDQLSDVVDPEQSLRPESDHVARHWKTLAEVPWFASLPDGFCANLGTGAADSSRLVASCATSGAVRVLVDGVPDDIPSGLWAYRIDSGHQLLGGAVNDVGRALDWLQRTLVLPNEPEAVDRLLEAKPKPATPLVLPFLTGERSTGWAADARAHVADLSAATTPELFYRGAVDGIAVTYARVAEQLRAVAGSAQEVLVSGSVTAERPGFLHVLAQALDLPVVRVPIKRATLHGTALVALEALDSGGERAAVPASDPVEPVEKQREYWAERRAAFEELYRTVVAP